MPIWNDGDASLSNRPQNTMQRVRAGRALPILSNTAMFDLTLFGHEPFLRYYAQTIAYPYPNLPDVSQLANYDRYANRSSDIECKEFYLSCLQNHIFREARAAGVDLMTLEEARAQADQVSVSAFANLLGLPRFDKPQTFPLLVLADLPFKVFVTISIMTFLEDALRLVGKEPVTKMCRWRGPLDAPGKDLWLISDSYSPSKEQPLVYHLCGLDAHPRTKAPLPDSLALTQEDHLELLMNLAQGKGKENVDRLPALVRGAMFDDALLLGFSLDSWAFRALYYGLIRHTGHEKDRRGLCCVQLPPDEREKQEKYLQGYLDREAHFDIFWGDLYQLAQTLRQP